ncbi:MAG: succinyl-diaminopimelate desuccinylase [Desulfurococcales archaeon ex4484_204]|nr:MAG: succinyl-diaminopimelate desuccinylase [Desulfurococcales archaeon ex4484_204]
MGGVLEGVLKEVEAGREWCVNVLKDMVSIPTVNPPGEHYGEFADLASQILRSIGMDVRVLEVPKDLVLKHYPECVEHPRYVVLGRAGRGGPVVQFNGHYDVVPPGGGWSRNPFSPTVSGGRLYGRGSVDMKGGIAASLLAVKSFLASINSFKGSVEVALVPDEEIGGRTGTGYLLNSGVSSPNYVVIGEPSGVNNIWIGHKGAVWAYVDIYGRQAHASTPWTGVNAFEYMVKIAGEFMKSYKPVVEGRRSSYKYSGGVGDRAVVTIGGDVRGGAKVNVVPGYYSFSIDRRVIPEEDVDSVEGELRDFINSLKGKFREVKVGLRVVNKFPPVVTSTNSGLVRVAAEAVRGITNSTPELTVCVGGLDMWYYSVRGVEVVAYGPGPVSNAHIADEFVSLKEVEEVAKVYATILYKLLTS